MTSLDVASLLGSKCSQRFVTSLLAPRSFPFFRYSPISLYFPASHVPQESDPGTLLKLPAGQKMQLTLSTVYLPASQFSQALSPTLLIDPGGQDTQPFLVALVNCPAGQILHHLAPLSSVYVPSSHLLHSF